MRYRERVAIEAAVEARSAKGAVSYTYETVEGLDDLPATIVPAQGETRGGEMTLADDRYDVILAGRHQGEITTQMHVAARGRRYAIEAVDELIGARQTWLRARLVTSPTSAGGS